MKQYYGCDAHKSYSLFAGINELGQLEPSVRVEHDRNSFRQYLNLLPPGSMIAIESVGNWYWLIEEMEKAGHIPLLTHPGKAKLMMGQINKTDKLDAYGLARLLRNGTLPSVWIPPSELRDQRELTRMRTALVKVRTMLKNRIHATLAKYAINIPEVSDIFGVSGRRLIETHTSKLPPQTANSLKVQLRFLDQVMEHIELAEKQIGLIITETPDMGLLMTIPGVGPILSIVISLEVGKVERFPSAEHLASYAGTVPRIKASGGRTFYGRVRPDVNRYLKWALIEAANVIMLKQDKMSHRHVVQLYRRIQRRKGHAKAIVALARHLAEATYWMLTRGEPYQEPVRSKLISSTQK